MTAPMQMLDQFRPLFGSAPYIICKGGRSGMKSHTIAEALVTIGRSQKKRILCAREIQKSISESVHQLLKDKIDKLGYQSFYRVTDHEITGQNGTQFFFAGLRSNFASLKSKEGLDIVWVEEAAKVSKDSWRTLLPTIRKPGSQLIVSFNPDQEDDPVNRLESYPGAVVIESSWSDNPWLTEKQLAEIRHDYHMDPETAEHVWGGGFNIKSNAQVFAGRYKVEEFTPQTLWFGPYFGADFGFAMDPNTIVKVWLSPDLRTGYVEHAQGGVGVTLNQMPELYRAVPGTQNLPSPQQRNRGLTVFNLVQPVIRADNSRPETINHLREFGFNVVAADKWAGSVEDGVTWMRSLNWVLHPQTEKTAVQEFKYYRYKTDSVTGDVLPVILDAHNHYIDAIRYALQPLISQPELTEIVLANQVNAGMSITPELDDLDTELELRGLTF